jgi:large subunit ribosomal protein L24
MVKIKKDDKVLIITGKDRGRIGKVLKSFPQKTKLLIEGINLRKKHVRPRREGEKGQIVEVPAPISISNVKSLCLKCNKAVRVGYKIEKGTKYRVCKKCRQVI